MSNFLDSFSEPVRRQLQRAYEGWANATSSYIEFPFEALEVSLPERFEQIARIHTDRIAVQTDDQALSYEALNRLANRLARNLVARSGMQNEPVAFLLDRGAVSIAAIIAILKAGKIYVALDPTTPPARLLAFLEDSQARVVVADHSHLALASELADSRSLTQSPVSILNLDELDASSSVDNLGLSIVSSAPAAIFYTSGSTGQPKGVVQTHRNLLYRAMTGTNARRICCDDQQPLFSSCSFAMSTGPIFNALLNGGTLLPNDLRSIGWGNLGNWLVQHKITMMTLNPSTLRNLMESLPNADERRFPDLRLLVLGGEAILRQDLVLWKQHFAPNSILENWYGSTEAMNVARFYFDKESPIPDDPIPVGYADLDVEVFLTNENGAPVGYGQVGEIAIKSRFLIPGYWRKPALTRAIFQPDPAGSDKRIHYTGDLGRMHPDGLLELVGRRDFQVKVRGGHRVQIDEVEMALVETPHIKEAVIIAQSKEGRQRLIAYLVTKQSSRPAVRDVRAALEAKLPDYMIPSIFIYLDSLPRTINGKIDRQALPEPEQGRPDLGIPYVAPRTELETRLASIWADVLELDQVGIDDNFFELGGDSLSALRMILEVEKIAQQPVPSDYFGHPTVAALAEMLEHSSLPTTNAVSSENPIHTSKTNHISRTKSRSFTSRVTATHALLWVSSKILVRMDYQQGIRWLRWIGQPTIANRLFREEQGYFVTMAQVLGNAAAASAEAFQISVLGNVIWLYAQQLRLRNTLVSDSLIDIMQISRDRFWQSYASRIDRAVSGEEYGQIIKFSGLEHLYQAHKLKRGTILLTYHSPAAAIANAILLRCTNLGNIPTISFESAQQMADREMHYPDESPEQRTWAWSSKFALQGQRILAQGDVVQIVNDVSYHDRNSIAKSIGGRRYDLKPGFAELALSTGARVLPVYSVYDLTGIVHTTILPALTPLGDTTDRTEVVDDLLDQYVAFLEDIWRKEPASMGWGALRRFVTRPRFATGESSF